MSRSLALIILILLLSACGFHLRGRVDVPEWLNNISIIADDADARLVSILKSQLDSYKIQVNPDPSLAKYWLIVKRTTVQQQIISIGASTNPRQYQIVMTVAFILQTKNGQVLKSLRQVTVNRQLTVNNDRILGSNEEESIVLGEMRQDAATQIINQLNRA